MTLTLKRPKDLTADLPWDAFGYVTLARLQTVIKCPGIADAMAYKDKGKEVFDYLLTVKCDTRLFAIVCYELDEDTIPLE
jgi:hypothetical protein